MKKTLNLSIRHQLFLLISICITVIMTAFLLVVTTVLQRYLVDQSVEMNSDKILVMNKGVQSIYDTAEEYIQMMAADIRLQEVMTQYKYTGNKASANAKNDVAIVASKAFAPTALAEQFMGAVLLDETGSLLYDGIRYELAFEDANLENSISAEACVETKRLSSPVWGNELFTVYSKMYTDRQYHVLPLYKVLRNVDSGEFLGYIVLFVNEKAFTDLHRQTSLFQNSAYYLVNEEGIVLSASDKTILMESLPQELSWMLDEDILELSWEGNPTLYVSTSSISNGERLLHVIPMNELLQQKNVLWTIAVCSMVLVVLMLCVCAWLITMRITKPIVILTSVMRRIEKEHDMSIRVEDNFHGEMAILTKGFNSLMEKQQKALQDIYQQQKEKRKLGLMLLQEQMNPHFLYNTLETISSLLMLKMEEKAAQACKSLSEFYKLSLSKGRDIITLEDEFRIVEGYLSIQSIRYVEYMEYSIECEDAILDCCVPKLLIQPVVENALYHGLKQQKKKGMILVSGRSNDAGDKVILEVIDTGNGIEEKRLAQIQDIINKGEISSSSFGISNMAVRLKALFGEECSVCITSTVGVATSVKIEFPMVRKDDMWLLKEEE